MYFKLRYSRHTHSCSTFVPPWCKTLAENSALWMCKMLFSITTQLHLGYFFRDTSGIFPHWELISCQVRNLKGSTNTAARKCLKWWKAFFLYFCSMRLNVIWPWLSPFKRKKIVMGWKELKILAQRMIFSLNCQASESRDSELKCFLNHNYNTQEKRISYMGLLLFL